MVVRLGQAVRALVDLVDCMGVSVRLCLELEFWIILETIRDVIEFWTCYFYFLGAVARDYFGFCYDCCH